MSMFPCVFQALFFFFPFRPIAGFPNAFNIMQPPISSLVIHFSLFSSILSNPLVPKPAAALDLTRSLRALNRTHEVEGFGDCLTCAAKCGLFFCTCSLACLPTTPGDPWTCYVSSIQFFHSESGDEDACPLKISFAGAQAAVGLPSLSF